MTVIDHLKGQNPEFLTLEVAFGRHVIAGDLAKSKVTGSDPSHVVHVQHILGEAFGKGWKGIVGAWFRGVNRDSTKYKFYPGIQSSGDSDPVQGVDSEFDLDTPHSNTAWVRMECPNGSESGIPEFDTKNNPPEGATFIVDCQTGDVYDDTGAVSASDVLLVNPADVIAFGCMVIQRYPSSRIDWAALDALRSYCDETVIPDYTTLPQGVGLTGKYYDGNAFDTLIRSRVDPIVDFPLSSGVPELGLSPDDFSVRWEGKIRAEYTETYTFQVVHNGGARLWVNDVLIIDQWGSSGTHTANVALTADQFYTIKLEWEDSTGDAEIRLQWSSASQPLETIPQDRLYPKDEAVKRFECHAAFTQSTTFDDFLRQVLFSCNGAFQDAGGKLKFFSIDDLTHSFDFTESRILKNTFKFSPRFTQQELLQLPNRFIANGRDLNSRYIEAFDPQVFIDLPELQQLAGRIIEEVVTVGNTTRWQAIQNLTHYAKVRTTNLITEFEAMPDTLQVLPGDLVRVSHSVAGWSNKQFLCLEATDKTMDRSADNRIFKHLEWT